MEAREALRDKICTRYQPSDVLSNVPMCECRQTTKRYRLGVICPNCNKPVTDVLDQKLESLIWLKTPIGVSKLINPMIWIILSNHFKKGRFNVIQWLCDTKYPVPAKPPKIFPKLLELGIQRGYNNFVQNFFNTVDNKGNIVGPGVIEKLLTISDFRKKKQDNPNEVHHILELIKENRDKIFSDYLALPNKTLLVVENTDMAIYVDNTTTGAIDAIDSVIGLDDPLNNYTPSARQNRVVKAIAQLCVYYQDFNKKTLSSKEGIPRKHLVATRCHWSARGVITSLTGTHDEEELHIPWGVAVGLLELHLANKLMKMNWMPNEIMRFLTRYAMTYHPLLDQLFKELISESEHSTFLLGIKGLPAIFQRNPSLGRGSMQSILITKVKTDPADQTISMSILTTRGYNADFDGDEMNLTMLMDNHMARLFNAMKPFKNVMDSSVPRKISGNLAKSKPWTSNMANLFEAAKRLPPDPVKLKRMDLIPEAA